MLVHGQTTAVLTGYVTDATTGKPMPFAHVYVNGSTQSTSTDEKGYYTLTGVPLGTVEIAISYVGYQPATRKIRFENGSPQKTDFGLKESEQMLDAITVRGNSKRSERQLRQFKKQLFGEPFGGQCLLVNSEVLNFKEDKDHLYATANEPLIIDNQALGYRMIYDLQHFDASSAGKVYFAGTTRFEELQPDNERQATQFRRNRLTAYKGSTRHLMATLTDNTFEQAGFLVYEEDATKPISSVGRAITLSAAISDYKHLVPIKISALIQPGRLPAERQLVSARKLVIFYTKATSNFSPYPDARYAYTEMKLPSGRTQMTVNGVITMPEGMETKGSMGNDRLSTMLPADWKPEGDQKELNKDSPLAIQGKLASPDTCSGRIDADFRKRFRLLSPILYVHMDKPLYATGDRIWMSMYLLDAANHQRPAGETAMHVDLLTSTGKLVQHQWIHIVDGRGQGNFRLSDTLITGTYRLRAYTDEDEVQRRPAFERNVVIHNLFHSSSSIHNDSVSPELDIQILPEGGRWIFGLPARLGVKITQPNGHGLLVEGRIVDDLGAEVVRFKTSRYGMTSIIMQPKIQRTYYAEAVYNGKLQLIPLPRPETEGLSLSADAVSDTSRLVLTIRNVRQAGTDSAYVLIQQRGRIVDQHKVFLQNGMAKVSLPMFTGLPGLMQITLYDALARPQAERLVFVPELMEPVHVMLKFDKVQYQPREQVLLNVHLNDTGLPAVAALSASVTDAEKVPGDTAEATLQSHLLLTGELRGMIENPNQYVANHTVETRQALDDLLLTQGWRRVSGSPESDSLGGVSLKGRILNAKNQPIPGAKIVLALTALGQSFVRSADADHQGQFRLAGMAITDTVQLVAQLADSHSKPFSTKEAFLLQQEPGRLWESGRLTVLPDWPALQAQLDAARMRQEANADLYRDKTAKELNEVTVRARKNNERPQDIQSRSLHNDADVVITFDSKSPVYSNLYEMIQGRIAGVTVSRTVPPPNGQVTPPGYKVTIRGMNSFNNGTQPLYLMDGIPVKDPDGTVLMNFNPGDIERIEVLKNAGTVGIYGLQGGNGVIAFYSKGARSMQANIKSRDVSILLPFIGYPSVQREFYVPVYQADATAATMSGPADNRDVLYWKPLMQTDRQGNSQLRFPLSDTVRTLRIMIQGITANGRPVLGVQIIHVQ
ncbi:hypothetical protein GCM10011325_26350 [Dyadobacter sediminis]|nr:hypothetical protein GCM10011325_26350 [Dyadobacter sediminis]